MAKKKHQFEAALRQLEEIVAHMESGELPLDECVEYYERAIKLAELCTQELDAARRRIEQVRVNEKGEAETEPLTVAESGAETAGGHDGGE